MTTIDSAYKNLEISIVDCIMQKKQMMYLEMSLRGQFSIFAMAVSRGFYGNSVADV